MFGARGMAMAQELDQNHDDVVSIEEVLRHFTATTAALEVKLLDLCVQKLCSEFPSGGSYPRVPSIVV